MGKVRILNDNECRDFLAEKTKLKKELQSLFSRKSMVALIIENPRNEIEAEEWSALQKKSENISIAIKENEKRLNRLDNLVNQYLSKQTNKPR